MDKKRFDDMMFGFILGMVIISIPLMWNIENLEAKVADLQQETPMFEYMDKQAFCQRSTR